MEEIIRNNAFWVVVSSISTAVLSYIGASLIEKQKFRNELRKKVCDENQKHCYNLLDFVEGIEWSIAPHNTKYWTSDYAFEANVHEFCTTCSTKFSSDLKLFLIKSDPSFKKDINTIRDILKERHAEASKLSNDISDGYRPTARDYLGYPDDLCQKVRCFVEDFSPRLREWLEKEMRNLDA
jgi:hypothetical protein